MKYPAIIIASLLIACTTSCNFKDDQSTQNNLPSSGSSSFSSNLDDDIWINRHTLIKGFAHSGLYCSRLDSAQEYSFGFTELLGNVGVGTVQFIDVRFCTLFPKTGVPAKFVVSIDREGTNKFWYGSNISDSIQVANEWKELSISVKIPADYSPEDRVMIYLWNPDHGVFYMDDLNVEFRQ